MAPGVRRFGTAVLAVLVVVAVACGGGDDDASGDRDATDAGEDTTTTVESTTTTTSEEDAVVAAVQAGLQAIDAAYDPPDPDHADLAATYAGEAFNGLRQQMLLYQGRGESQVGDLLDESYEVLTLAGDAATVRTCTREQFQDVDTATREPTGPLQEEVVHAIQDLERIEGTWKIVGTEFLAEPCSFD